VKTDSELGYGGEEVALELMRRAIAKRGVTAVKVEIGVEAVGHL
jgi:isocitrate lyase